MTTAMNEQQINTGDIELKYYNAYFGIDSYYYLPLMIDFYSGKKIRFNGWAFWGGMLWQIYRRQYRALLITFSIAIAFAVIEKIIDRFGSLGGNYNLGIHYLSTLIIALIIGFTGNFFIMRRAQQKTKEILAKNEDEDITLLKLEKAGSGNKAGVYITILLFIGLIVLKLVLKSQM